MPIGKWCDGNRPLQFLENQIYLKIMLKYTSKRMGVLLMKNKFINVEKEAKDIAIAMEDKEFILNMQSREPSLKADNFEDIYISYCQKYELDAIHFLTSISSKNEKGIKEGITILNRWFKFSYDHKINVFEFFANHLSRQCYLFAHGILKYDETAILEDKFADKLKHIIMVVLSNVLDILHLGDYFDNSDEIIMKQLKEALNKSFQIAIDSINDVSLDMLNNLPINNISLDYDTIVDDMQHAHNITKNIFENKKSFSKFLQGNHHLAKLKDDLHLDFEHGLIFPNYTEGLLKGYTSKALLLSIDKNSTIRGLETKIRHLEDYALPESDKLISFTRELIEFIKQKKHADSIPFKIIAKYLGMTKNEAKNYTKKVLNINEKSFLINYSSTKEIPLR